MTTAVGLQRLRTLKSVFPSSRAVADNSGLIYAFLSASDFCRSTCQPLRDQFMLSERSRETARTSFNLFKTSAVRCSMRLFSYHLIALAKSSFLEYAVPMRPRALAISL